MEPEDPGDREGKLTLTVINTPTFLYLSHEVRPVTWVVTGLSFTVVEALLRSSRINILPRDPLGVFSSPCTSLDPDRYRRDRGEDPGFLATTPR